MQLVFVALGQGRYDFLIVLAGELQAQYRILDLQAPAIIGLFFRGGPGLVFGFQIELLVEGEIHGNHRFRQRRDQPFQPFLDAFLEAVENGKAHIEFAVAPLVIKDKAVFLEVVHVCLEQEQVARVEALEIVVQQA